MDSITKHPKSLEELGYTFFGPLVFNYFNWLKDEVKDGDLILFNSREGYFLNELYQEFKGCSGQSTIFIRSQHFLL